MTSDVTDVLPPLAMTLVMGLLVFSFLWLIHVRRRDASLVDYWWGAGFAAIAWVEFATRSATGPLHVFVTLAVTAWAARLTLHLVARHRGHGCREDRRYAAMRARNGPDWWKSNLFTVFWLQALLQWLLAAPVHVALLAGPPDLPQGASLAVAMVGAALFLAGFAIEWAADAELARFTADPANRGRLLTTGLWGLSRHPNYFGEALLWWGLGLIAASASGQWWVLVAPAALTFLLVRVSGVPLVEEHLSGRPGWADYAARTAVFVPWITAAGPSRKAPDRSAEPS